MNCTCNGPTAKDKFNVTRCTDCGKLAGGDAFRPMPCAKGTRCTDFNCTAPHEAPAKKPRKRPRRSLSASHYRD